MLYRCNRALLEKVDFFVCFVFLYFSDKLSEYCLIQLIQLYRTECTPPEFVCYYDITSHLHCCCCPVKSVVRESVDVAVGVAVVVVIVIVVVDRSILVNSIPTPPTPVIYLFIYCIIVVTYSQLNRLVGFFIQYIRPIY